MATKSVLVLFVGLLTCLILFTPATAGGWAAITLDQLPEGVVAGDPFEISFSVRQHGVRPMAGLTPLIHFSHIESTDTISVAAREQGPTGHYAAELTLPHPGAWNWSIEAFSMNQPMPPVQVLSTSSAQTSNLLARPSLPLLVGILGLSGAAAALALSLRRRTPWAFVPLIAALLLGGIGFSVAASQGNSTASRASAGAQMGDSGMALFVAKGCVTCHTHGAIDRTYLVSAIDAGPNLTNFTADADYLRRWLKDPASVKPSTLMPDLELSDAEIEALIAFLNEKE